MIGVFDSGLGGLTILKALTKRLGEYDYIYLGDNARTPYGSKSQSVIYEYTRQAVEWLFSQGCYLIILACNTASAKALRQIQQEWLPKHYPKRRVLGVVIPVAEEAVEQSRYGRIGVIGTRSTIQSHVYEQELNKIYKFYNAETRHGASLLDKNLEIHTKATPLLVPLVEEGWVGKPETNMILKKYLLPLKQKSIDTLILGCTHYPFLQKDIKRIMGKSCQVLDAPAIVADKLDDYLKRHSEIEKKLSKNEKRIFYTTDEPGQFKSLGQKFLGKKIDVVRKIEL